MVRYADPGVVEWVESSGGPLVVIPESALPSWLGADSDEHRADYESACEVDDWIGLISVGQEFGLVLGGEPASTAFLPQHGLFVRWCAAESEAEFLEGVGAAIEVAVWEPELLWDVSGPVVLPDAVWSGSEFEGEDHVRVALEPGRYAVCAAYVEPNPLTSLVLVQLRSLP
ncbi:Imm21 family immunity protein [Streptomyces sp. CA-106131]|uniref:Imm21 family immunity protein n=1 Tax=Streptomyces sp. CA-106131 TaxID=3240045 RepID=UPI003D8B5629